MANRTNLKTWLVMSVFLLGMRGMAQASWDSDNFNDNTRDPMWILYEENPGRCWLQEINNRLEVRATVSADDVVALYVSSWKLDVNHDFSLKLNFHYSRVSWNDGWVLIGLTPDLTNPRNTYAEAEAGCDENQPYFWYKLVEDGVSSDSDWMLRSSNDGTVYISYSANNDELYVSTSGYWSGNADLTKSGLLKGGWGGAPVYVGIGGGSEYVSLSSGHAYLDNFVVDSGTLHTPTGDPYEPDDSSSQANWIYSGIPQTHSIVPAGDYDWVKFSLSTESEVVIETSGTAGDDTYMWLFDSSSLLEEDDDSGIDYFSRIDRLCGVDALPAGTYYVEIDEFGNNDEIPSYDITLTVTACDAGGTSPVYRFWSPVNSRHFYTMVEAEKDKLIDIYAHVWTYEGIGYYAFAAEDSEPGLVPVYRFWSPVLVAHFYTISESERDKLINIYPHVWTPEGIAFYVYAPDEQPVDAKPVYRFWSGTLGTHFYTIDETEANKLIDDYSNVWTHEYIAWYAYTSY